MKDSSFRAKEAIEFMEEREEPYKVELIKDLPEDAVISASTSRATLPTCAQARISIRPAESRATQ